MGKDLDLFDVDSIKEGIKEDEATETSENLCQHTDLRSGASM
jgi:hypothetical protein